jgi:hypothetical protein
MRPLQSRAWTRRGEEGEEDEDEDGFVDFPLCKLPPRAEIYRRRRRRRRRRSRRIPSFFHLERFRIGASEHLEREREFREERRERRGVCGVGNRSLFVV